MTDHSSRPSVVDGSGRTGGEPTDQRAFTGARWHANERGGTAHARRVYLAGLRGPPQGAGYEAASRPVPGGRLPGPLRRPNATHAPGGVGLLRRRGGGRAQEVDVGGVQAAALRGD